MQLGCLDRGRQKKEKTFKKKELVIMPCAGIRTPAVTFVVPVSTAVAVELLINANLEVA